MSVELIIYPIIAIAVVAVQVLTKPKAPKPPDSKIRGGFETVTENTAHPLPVVYGRAKVGGNRLFHSTFSFFHYVEPSADTWFVVGSNSQAAGSYTISTYDIDGSIIEVTRNYDDAPAEQLTKDQSGTKNEFLLFQQTFCVGPINAVRDVCFDNTRYLDDPSLYDWGVKDTGELLKKISSGLRVDYHLNGGVDSIAAANAPQRATASFDDIAYLTACVRLNEKNVQFNGMPDVTSFIEGRKIRPITFNGSDYSVADTRIYSVNPALCLLDYLLDKDSGRGVRLGEIDLKSFYEASLICGKVVMENAAVSGKIWRPTSQEMPQYWTRPVYLFECNIIIDTDKPVRENIESILGTMADARLVWSAGTYKLKIVYPNDDGSLPECPTITDDDLSLGQEFEIKFPSASDKYNRAVVKFHNEFENFKEDLVSWPPRTNDSGLKGLGGIKLPLAKGGLDEEGKRWQRNQFLNQYGIFDSASTSMASSGYFIVEKERAGTYEVIFGVLNTGHFTIYESSIDDNNVITDTEIMKLSIITEDQAKSLTTGSIYLGDPNNDKAYRVLMEATGQQDTKSFGARIHNDSYTIWTTRFNIYDRYVSFDYNTELYDLFLEEDNDVKLEYETFEEGMTDPYHALARAEEIVRTSRGSFVVKFSYILKSVYLEPGDLFLLNSKTLFPFVEEPIHFKVDSSRVKEGTTCEITATRFHPSMVAWSDKYDFEGSIPPIYDSIVPAPEWVVYLPSTNVNNSSGTLEWATVSISDLSHYNVYYSLASTPPAEDGRPVFSLLGTTINVKYVLPKLEAPSAFFGVQTVTTSGRTSDVTFVDPFKATTIQIYSYRFLGLTIAANPTNHIISWSNFQLSVNDGPYFSVANGSTDPWTGDVLYVYLLYARLSSGVEYAEVFWTTDFYVASSGRLLAEYDGVNLIIYTSELKPPVNLRIGGTDGTVFENKDANIVWDNNPENSAILNTIFKYGIQILDLDYNVVYETTVEKNETYGGSYSFTLEKNITHFGIPTRKFVVRVAVFDTSGFTSEAVQATFENTEPVITSLNVLPSFNSVTTRCSIVDHPDLVAYVFKQYESDSSETPLVVIESDANYAVFPVEDTLERYYTVAAKDPYGEGPEFAGLLSAALKKDPDLYTYVGLTFYPNTPNTNQVSWDSFDVLVNGDFLETVSAGVALFENERLFIFYIPNSGILEANPSMVYVISAGGRILATYNGGSDLSHDEGKAFISGDQLLAGTVGANALVTNTAIITNAAQIGNVLESDNFVADGTNFAGWRIDKQGFAQFQDILIRAADGTPLFASGTGFDWYKMFGLGLPAPNATNSRVFVDENPPQNDGTFTENYIWYDSANNNHPYTWNGTSWVSVKDADIAFLEGVVDGKTYSFYQPTIPENASLGDLWFDTANGNKVYFFDGETWSDASDSEIVTALNAAIEAQDTADGKVVTYSASVYPTSCEGIGDLFFHTEEQILYRTTTAPTPTWLAVGNHYTNTSQLFDDAELGSTALWNSITGANKPQDNATKSNVYRQDNAPSSSLGLTTSDLWVDTNDRNHLYSWNGSSWVSCKDTNIAILEGAVDGLTTTYYQPNTPSGASLGDIWIDTDAGYKMYVYNNGWQSAQDSSISDALLIAAGAQATADSKIRTYSQSTAPSTVEGVGDLWFNTSNLKFYRSSTAPTASWSEVANNFTNTNQLIDGASLGLKALWSNVADNNGLRPEDGADVTANHPQSPDWLTSLVIWSGNKLSKTVGADGFIGNFMNSLAVDTSYINNLAVTNGKIADLSVDTLKIANQAVTVPNGAFTSSVTAIPNTNVWTEVARLTLTTSSAGIPYFVTFGFNHAIQYGATDSSMSVKVTYSSFGGSGTLYNESYWAYGNSSMYDAGSNAGSVYTATDPNLAVTVYLYVKQSGMPLCNVANRYIQVIGLKK